jgi:hypothetical protein
VRLPPPFPLFWPDHVPRSEHRQQGKECAPLSAYNRLFGQLMRHTKPKHFRITSDLELDNDSLPIPLQGEPPDPGICVYLESGIVWAFDRYTSAAANLWGLGSFLMHYENAIREAPRSYAGPMLGAFLVPAPPPAWAETIFGRNAKPPDDLDAVERMVKFLTHTHHPDRGGNEARFRELLVAREAARQWYASRA